MADSADDALDMQQAHLDASLRAARPATPGGAGGVCDTCELDSPRLFDGECAWCHDGRERPEEHQPEPAFKIAAQPAPAVREAAAIVGAAVKGALKGKRLPTAPYKGMGQGYRPAKVATRQDRRQVNVHFPSDRHDEVLRLSAEMGSTPSAWARSVFMSFLDGDLVPSLTPGRKPFIPAEVIRAAREADQPLDVYVTALIARGFAAVCAEQEGNR